MIHSLSTRFAHITPIYHNNTPLPQIINYQNFPQSWGPQKKATLDGILVLQILFRGEVMSLIEIKVQ
jgi:hypothetical protein